MAAVPEVEVCKCCGQTVAKTARLSAQRHLETIDKLYDYSEEDLKSKRGPDALARARNHYWFLLVVEDLWSLPRAGRKTGHGHHAVMSGVRRHSALTMGTHSKMSMKDIRLTYWLQLGYSDEEACERAGLD